MSGLGELESVTQEQLDTISDEELEKIPERSPDLVVETEIDDGTGSVYHHSWIDSKDQTEFVLVTSDITSHGNFAARYDLDEKMFAKYVKDAQVGSESMDLLSITEEAKCIALALA